MDGMKQSLKTKHKLRRCRDKMEIYKTALQTMIQQFWSTNSNPHCVKMSILFLRKIGLEDKEIIQWLDIRGEFPTIDEEDEYYYREALGDTELQ